MTQQLPAFLRDLPPFVSYEDMCRRREQERFERKVEHHGMHCDGCPDPRLHLRNQKRRDTGREPIFGASAAA